MTTSEKTIQPRCICCGIRTTSETETEMMDGASAWRGNGNYGSRVLDDHRIEDQGHTHEIHVCDLCLVLNAERVLVYTYKGEGRERRVETPPKVWEPPKAGPNRRRHHMLIWENEDGTFSSFEGMPGGGGCYNGVAQALEQSFLRLQRSVLWSQEISTMVSCRRRLEKDLVGMSEKLQRVSRTVLDAIEERFPQGQFWGSVRDHGMDDYTGDEPRHIENYNTHIEARLVPGCDYVEVYIGENAVGIAVNFNDTIYCETDPESPATIEWLLNAMVNPPNDSEPEKS